MSKEKGDLSPLTQRIVDQFNNRKIRVIEVPEWGEEEGAPLKVYVGPVTMAQKGKFLKEIRNLGEVEAYINLLVAKAMDAEGKKLFTIADKVWLMNNADDRVTFDLCLQMYSRGDEDEGEETLAEK